MHRENAGQSEVMQTRPRSSPTGVELSETLFIAVSDHLAAQSHFIIKMASSASGIRPSSVSGMRCYPS